MPDDDALFSDELRIDIYRFILDHEIEQSRLIRYADPNDFAPIALTKYYENVDWEEQRRIERTIRELLAGPWVSREDKKVAEQIIVFASRMQLPGAETLFADKLARGIYKEPSTVEEQNIQLLLWNSLASNAENERWFEALAHLVRTGQCPADFYELALCGYLRSSRLDFITRFSLFWQDLMPTFKGGLNVVNVAEAFVRMVPLADIARTIAILPVVGEQNDISSEYFDWFIDALFAFTQSPLELFEVNDVMKENLVAHGWTIGVAKNAEHIAPQLGYFRVLGVPDGTSAPRNSLDDLFDLGFEDALKLAYLKRVLSDGLKSKYRRSLQELRPDLTQ